MLRLENVTVLQDDFRLSADLAIREGARVAVIGPSGAGKSTLLSAIAGFYPPASGRVLWQDRDLTPLPPGDRPLPILFQDQNLFPHLTVGQNVGLGIRPDLRLSAGEQEKVADALSRVGLAGMGERRPGTLSGGQQSRVALARVILRGRPLMLLDEPFDALGPALRGEMLDLVAGIAGAMGATLLMVSHNPADALRIAPETILVAEGRAHPPQPTAELLANPPPALAAYLGK